MSSLIYVSHYSVFAVFIYFTILLDNFVREKNHFFTSFADLI